MLTAPDDPALVRATRSFLGPADFARADRRSGESGRRRTLLGRALLRILAGELLGISPREVVTGASPRGAPQAGVPGMRLAVSVAHTAGLVAVAAGDAATRVGVDVERLDRRTRPAAIARRYFTPEEAAALPRLPGALRASAFLRAWTLKEAWGKAAGHAVPAALSRIGFPMTALAAAPPSITEHSARWPQSGSEPERRWVFWTTTVGGTHALGVAAFPASSRTALSVRPLSSPPARP